MNRELLEDIFVTALEGGSNYWYLLQDKTVKKIRKAVPKSEDPHLSTAIVTAILDHNVDVEVHDLDNPDEVLGVLNYNNIELRLSDLDKHLDYRWALEAHDQEFGDADSADVVFQYLVLGDVWFA